MRFLIPFLCGCLCSCEDSVELASFPAPTPPPLETLECPELLREAMKPDRRIRRAAFAQFLEKGCDPNQRIKIRQGGDSVYTTALFEAVRSHGTPTIEALLQAGGLPNEVVRDRLTPMHYAAGRLSNRVLELLHRYGGQYTIAGTPTLFQMISSFDFYVARERIRYLLDQGVDPQHDRSGALLSMALGDRMLFKRLLDIGVDPNGRFSIEHGDCISCPEKITPAFSAAGMEQGGIPYLKILRAYGGDLLLENGYGENLLEYQIWAEPEVIQYLLDQGVPVRDALTKAAGFQQETTVALLLENGADPNRRGPVGSFSVPNRTPLSAAIWCCGDGFHETALIDRLGTIRLLLENGAIPTERELDFLRKATTGAHPLAQRTRAILGAFGYL